MADEKEFMEDQLRIPGVPKFSRPDQLRVGVWVGMAVGLVMGCTMRLREMAFTSREVMYVRLVGDLWLSAMRALALPLFMCTLIISIYDLSVVSSFHIFWQMILVVLLFRVWLGVQTAVVASMSNAGSVTLTERSRAMADLVATPTRHTPGDAVLDMLKNTFADNPVEALVRSTRSSRVPPWDAEHGTGDLYAYTLEHTVYYYQANLLGLTLSLIAVGVATVLLRKEVQSLLLAARVVNDACSMMALWLLVAAAPFVGVCVAADIAGAHDFRRQFNRMWPYLLTLGIQLVVQLNVIYPLLLALTTGWRSKRPFAGIYLLWFSSDALIIACISGSAHVAFPMMLRCIQRIQGIDTKAASFALAVLSVCLSDGTAIYLTTAGTWAAQDQDRKLIKYTKGYVYAGLLSAVGSISSAAESQKHPALMVMIAATLGAQTRSIDLAPIMLWDWMLGAYAAAVNIGGAFYMALILGYFSNRRKLRLQEQGRAVNEPPDLPPSLPAGETLNAAKPDDAEVYPPLEEDPELDEIRAKCQVHKEKRMAKHAEREALRGLGDAERAKAKQQEAERAAEEAERRLQEAAAAADRSEEA